MQYKIDKQFKYLFKKYKWFVIKNNYSNGYLATQNNKKIVYLHRMILNIPNGMVADHINGDTLDNRLSNLRISTWAQNTQNRKKSKNCISKYKGVTWDKNRKYWISQLTIQDVNKRLGCFKNNEHNAALMYDFWANFYWGKYAKTNFNIIYSK